MRLLIINIKEYTYEITITLILVSYVIVKTQFLFYLLILKRWFISKRIRKQLIITFDLFPVQNKKQ